MQKPIFAVVLIINQCRGLSSIAHTDHIGHEIKNVDSRHCERRRDVGYPFGVTSPIAAIDSNTQSPSGEISSSLSTRRGLLDKSIKLGLGLTAMTVVGHKSEALAATSDEPTITSKIFLQLKGLPDADEDPSSPSSPSPDKIVIGLYGKVAPQPTQILTQLVSPQGYRAPCKARETRSLQREQLEANKVYNSCLGSSEFGVTYDSSTVWRVVKDERIDLGAVSGKFISREAPNFGGGAAGDTGTGEERPSLRHDREGVVSMSRGGDGGFGFTIYPGSTAGGKGAAQLDEDNIIVGQVIEGMDVVRRLNEIPVIKSAGASFGSIVGGAAATKRSAPSRGCRYGGSEAFCSEFKPLRKILITNTGVL